MLVFSGMVCVIGLMFRGDVRENRGDQNDRAFSAETCNEGDMTFAPRSYSPILAGFLVLWPIMAYMGAQGFTGSVALGAIFALFYLRLGRPQLYALVFLGLIGWIFAASYWAPEAKPFLAGNLFSGSFTMDMAGARFGLAALAGMAMIVAAKGTEAEGSRLSLWVIMVAGLIQGAGVIVTAVFMPQILSLLAPISDPVREMPQNLIRNANTFFMLLPILLAWLWFKTGSDYWKLGAMILFTLSLGAFMQTGSQTALIGLALMVAGILTVRFFPENGFKILFTTLAAYVVSAPMLISWGIGQIRSLNIPLPRSFFSRSYSWELVEEKVGEAPFTGHGLEASHTWKDTYGQHPEWLADAAIRYGDEAVWSAYRITPSHPHNMPLQIWAETGMVGAILAALFLFLLGWRLKAPQDWPPTSRYAAAGLIGACFAICSFAYSMWNEAFWASVAIAAAVIVLQARHDGKVGE